MEHQNTSPIIVAVDDGFAKTKVVCLDPESRVELMMSSYARTGLHGASYMNEAEEQVHPCYESDGQRFTVDENLHDVETARFDGYPLSAMNRAIVNHAIRTAALKAPALLERPLHLTTGLPLRAFYSNGKPNKDYIEKKKAALMQPIVSLDGSPMPRIARHEVFAEGLAAWIDWAVDDQMKLREDALEMRVGIIDVGGRTTDVAVVLPGRQIDHVRSGSSEIGAHNVMETMKSELLKKFEVQVTQQQAEKAMSGQVKMWGKMTDVSDLAQRAVRETSEMILRDINRRLGGGADLDVVLLVGGGAHLFGCLSEVFRNIEIAPNPTFANARGFAKYLALQG